MKTGQHLHVRFNTTQYNRYATETNLGFKDLGVFAYTSFSVFLWESPSLFAMVPSLFYEEFMA